MPVFEAKLSNEIHDYQWDITTLATGENVTSHTLNVLSGGITIVSSSSVDSRVNFRVSGGTAGAVARIQLIVICNNDEVHDELGVIPISAEYTAQLAEFRRLFSAFEAVNDNTVQYWLDRANLLVDDSWIESDIAHARLILAAHYLTANGQGTGAESEMAANGAGGFTRMKSGQLELQRDSSATDKMGEFGGTMYGRQFWPILKRNRSGPVVTDTGTYPTYPAGLLYG